ncbi:MAG: undecaprenyl-diphosphate phosphatase [Actinomycetota bacterium]
MTTIIRPPAVLARLRRRHTLAAGLLVGLAVAAWQLPVAAQDGAGAKSDIGLSVFAAIVLGLVEGFTEYLPVSSTGHLLVTNELLGLGGTDEADDALDAYAICIQAGAILAVLVLYQERIRQIIDGLLGRSEDGRRILLAVIAAFIPTAIIGLTVADFVQENLFGIVPIGIAWLIGGIGILVLTRLGVLRRAGQELYEITWQQAAIIGVGQAIALWPGVSRSLVTIVVAVLVGLTLRAAVEFSFLLGLVTLSAATALTALTDGELLVDTFGYVTPAIGLIVAFIAAIASVRWMVSWLEQRSFDVFGYYRIVIGIAALTAAAAGWL